MSVGSGDRERAGADSDLTVEIATTEGDLRAGMEFCGGKYLETYGACWVVDPDVLFIAKREGRIVATAGLELGRRRPRIDTEKYFRLSPGMRAFIDAHRFEAAEFGRFSSDDSEATRSVFHALLTYCRQAGIDYLFAWANPKVYTHGAAHHGVSFWVIDVDVNEEAVHTDTDWTTPPVRFFLRPDPPRVLLAIVPFLDFVNHRLALAYRKPLALAE